MSKRFIYYGSFASVQFFSDLFGMPAAAYSLRKLTPNATNCIRVRRSSDNTEQDIGFVANSPNSPIDTTALLAFVGAGDGFVATWYDQSTNSRNGTQTTSTRQVRIVNSGVVEDLNSLPCLNTFATNTFRDFQTSFSNLQNLPVSILSVFKIDTLPTNIFDNITFSIGGNSTSGGGGRYEQSNDNLDNNTTQRRNTSGVVGTSISESATVHKIFASYFTASNIQMRLNSVDATPVSYTGSPRTDSGNFNLINGNSQPSTGAQFQGAKRFQEQIIYLTDLHSQRTAIETNINDYYNVF
jgi:hypothetical protein